MSDAAAVARQWASQQLLLKFFLLLDEKRYEEVAVLFDVDGIWERPSSTCSGQDEILAALRARPAQRSTHHVVSNFLIQDDDGRTVKASCLLTTYAADVSPPGSAPALVDSLAGLYRAHATLSTDGGEPRLIRLKLASAWTSDRIR
jgi:hypothetical protein